MYIYKEIRADASNYTENQTKTVELLTRLAELCVPSRRTALPSQDLQK